MARQPAHQAGRPRGDGRWEGSGSETIAGRISSGDDVLGWRSRRRSGTSMFPARTQRNAAIVPEQTTRTTTSGSHLKCSYPTRYGLTPSLQTFFDFGTCRWMLNARLHFHNVELCLIILDFNQLANMLGFGVVPFFTLNQGYQSLNRIFDLGRSIRYVPHVVRRRLTA